MDEVHPKIINIMAASIDGKIAFHAKESSAERRNSGFINDADFKRMQKLVASCDVVFLGARSIETEQGAFLVSHLRPNNDEPEWIIFTRSGELPFSSGFWRQKKIKKSLFFVSSFDLSEPPQLTKQQTEFGLTQYLGNISGLLRALSTNGVKKIALLGGGILNGAFWEQKLINELYLSLSPLLIGCQDAPCILSTPHVINQKLKLQSVSKEDDFLFLDYLVI